MMMMMMTMMREFSCIRDPIESSIAISRIERGKKESPWTRPSILSETLAIASRGRRPSRDGGKERWNDGSVYYRSRSNPSMYWHLEKEGNRRRESKSLVRFIITLALIRVSRTRRKSWLQSVTRTGCGRDALTRRAQKMKLLFSLVRGPEALFIPRPEGY